MVYGEEEKIVGKSRPAGCQKSGSLLQGRDGVPSCGRARPLYKRLRRDEKGQYKVTVTVASELVPVPYSDPRSLLQNLQFSQTSSPYRYCHQELTQSHLHGHHHCRQQPNCLRTRHTSNTAVLLLEIKYQVLTSSTAYFIPWSHCRGAVPLPLGRRQGRQEARRQQSGVQRQQSGADQRQESGTGVRSQGEEVVRSQETEEPGDRSPETGVRDWSQEPGRGDRRQEPGDDSHELTIGDRSQEPLLSACLSGSQDIVAGEGDYTSIGLDVDKEADTDGDETVLDCGGYREKRRSDLRIRPRIQSPHPSVYSVIEKTRTESAPRQSGTNTSARLPSPSISRPSPRRSGRRERRETRRLGGGRQETERASCQAGARHLHGSLPHRTVLRTEHREERPAVSGEEGEQVVSPPQSEQRAQHAPAAPPWRDSSRVRRAPPSSGPHSSHTSLSRPAVEKSTLLIICKESASVLSVSIDSSQSVTLPGKRRQRSPKVCSQRSF